MLGRNLEEDEIQVCFSWFSTLEGFPHYVEQKDFHIMTEINKLLIDASMTTICELPALLPKPASPFNP